MNTLSTAPLIVRSLPPLWGAPAPSPFAIKLETWLRMAGIGYEAKPLMGPPRSATGKIPYVELADGRVLHDSSLIVATLGRERGVDLDEGLSAVQRATAHAVRRMVEEHLYFCGVYDRWISDAGYACTARDYFRHLPAPMRLVLPWVLRRRMRRYLHGQGIGRHPPEVVAAHARADVDAIAAILGDQEFLLGRPSTVDATLTGFLWGFTCNPFPSAVGAAVAANPNLVAYVARMKARYWSDWTPS